MELLMDWFLCLVFLKKILFQENCLVASLTLLSGDRIKARLALADAAAWLRQGL